MWESKMGRGTWSSVENVCADGFIFIFLFVLEDLYGSLIANALILGVWLFSF